LHPHRMAAQPNKQASLLSFFGAKASLQSRFSPRFFLCVSHMDMEWNEEG
jgi:hypothetical protein